MIELARLEPIESTAHIGPVARAAVVPFDLDPSLTPTFRPYALPELPQDFAIGLIVGSSGSGKSTLLKEFAGMPALSWDDRSVADYFPTPQEAMDKFAAVGLNSVPLWLKRYGELSTGERFRVELARQLHSHSVIDEFTSVVDRNVALSASVSVSRYIRNSSITNMVFATCHRDVIGWLSPDWIIDTDSGELHLDSFTPPQWHKRFITGETIGNISVTV